MTGPNIHISDPALLAGVSNGFLRYAIRSGRPGTAMPSFATLGNQSIEDVIVFVRGVASVAPALAKPAAAQPPPLPLGPVPLNPKGPEPRGLQKFPATTHAELIHAELARHARMALLDARAPSDYTEEHIVGAVSVPYYDPRPYLSALPKNTWLVSYCACPHAESGELAQKLVAAGFTKVTVLEEGLGFWKSKKYETHKGTKP
jgi:rhodanese-related sulfurtransferase